MHILQRVSAATFAALSNVLKYRGNPVEKEFLKVSLNEVDKTPVQSKHIPVFSPLCRSSLHLVLICKTS